MLKILPQHILTNGDYIMDKKLSTKTIFLSSTYEDLKDFRRKALDVITSLKQTYEGMEFFGADTRTPLDVMLDKLSYCQLYIGIIGMRYGSVDKNTQKSYTELEYEKARDLGIPCLIYIIDEENALIAPKYVDRGVLADKLDAFKNKLRSEHVIKKFISPDSLGEALQHDLRETMTRLNAEEEKQITSAQKQKNHKESPDEKSEYKQAEKFLLRPVKYHGTEVNITFCMLDDINGWRLKSKISNAFGLNEDDTASCEVIILPPSDITPSVNEITRHVPLYLSGDVSEWMVEQGVQQGAIIKAKVRLLSAKLSDVTDEGTPELIVGIVLLEGQTVIAQ